MEFNLEDVKEYEGIIRLSFRDWTEFNKVNFINWIKNKNLIKELDKFMNIYYEDYLYNEELKEYLNIGFEIIYSYGDKKHPIREDFDAIIENEKIIFQKEHGIIGNITKIRTPDNNIKLSANSFYYEANYSLFNNQIFEIRQLFNASPTEIETLIRTKNLITPWTKSYDELFLTKKSNSKIEDTLLIISTLSDEIINALGYEKREGKIYSKN